MTPSSIDRCQRGRDPVIRDDGSVEIPLTQGKVTIVDAESYASVSGRIWSAMWSGGHFRAYRRGTGGNPVYMSRVIYDGSYGTNIDHINHDTLDNRLQNLRPVSVSQNQRNRAPLTGCSSRFKGVHWHTQAKKWRARIHVSGRRVSLGMFRDEKEAALAYDRAAIMMFGQYALTNAAAGILGGES